MKIIFGTDGWRGKLDTELNKQNVARVAQAFSLYLKQRYPEKQNLTVAVGYDGRKYSREFGILFSRVLSGNSITALLSEKINTTPVLSHFVKNEKLEAGVMITASHNPAEYNGIKFKDYYGGPFFTEETLKVEQLIDADLVQANDDNVRQIDFRNSYYETLEKSIDLITILKSGVHPLVDSMGGAGQQVIENLLTRYEIPVKTIYKIADEEFSGRNAEPIEANLKPLSDALQAGSFSLGVATDGDADRVGLMSEQGKWISAQETILLLADYWLRTRKVPGDIVRTASVTNKLKLVAKKAGVSVIDTQVGFKYICEEMLKGDISFGCEESGGYGFKGHMPERDGIFSSLLLMEMIAVNNCKTIGELLEMKRKEYGTICYDRIDYHTDMPERENVLPRIQGSKLASIAGKKISGTSAYLSSRGVINGLKYEFDDLSWLLIRCSETEPMFRVYSEADTDADVKSLLNAGISLINGKE